VKPVRLEIENLRSFGSPPQPIDFGEARLFAILGDTGAGKTSILEAITYALFNRSTWDGREVTALIAKGARSMSVTFVFEVDGDQFTVTRVTRQNRQPTQRLDCPARGISVSTQADVKAEIHKALGLDAETFLHTVLLPQGKHAELLTKDRNSRNKILAEIFRLDEIELVLNRAKVLEARADTALSGFRKEREQLGADPAAALEVAAKEMAEVEAALQAAVAGVAEGKSLDEATRRIDRELIAQRDRLTHVVVPEDAIARLDAIERLEKEIRGEEQQVEEQVSAAKEACAVARERLESLRSTGLDTSALRIVERRLDAADAEQRELDGAETKAEALSATLLLAKASSQEAKALLDTACARESGDKQALLDGSSQLLGLSASLRSLREALATCDRLKEALDRAEQAAQAKATALEALKTQCAEAATEESKARLAHDAAQAALESAQIRDQAATLSSHLHAGDACPVCARVLPKNFSTPVVDGLTEAQSEAGRLFDNLSQCIQQNHRLSGEVTGAASGFQDARASADLASTEYTISLAHLTSLVPKDAKPATYAERLQKSMEAHQEEVATLQAAAAQSASSLSTATAAYAKAEAETRSTESQLEESGAEIKRRREHLRLELEQLPKAFATDGSDNGIERSREHVSAAKEDAESADQALNLATTALVAADRRAAGVAERRGRDISAPLQHLLGTLSPVATAVGLPPSPEAKTGARDWIERVTAKAGEERKRCNALISENTNELDKLGQQRSQLVDRLGGDPEVVKAGALVAHTEVKAKLGLARKSVADAKIVDAKIARLEPIVVGLSSLKTALGARGFPIYATACRQQRLLEIASGILGEMVDGRYAFTSDFEILDRQSNEVRSTQTLSGGEKFLGSLALSLAVVEIAANSGAKIDALFLDEGFDSLDADTLSLAMMELRKRTRSGRMISVITHVKDVAQFVNDTYIVRKTGDGSHVTHLDGPLEEDSAALEGLVAQLA
jgi:DNA repair protein SbcC/Rad50